MKIVYWACECLTDSRCYNIRERTKKEAAAARAKYLDDGGKYGPPTKIVIEYADGFDLMTMCCGEGGSSEETQFHALKGERYES